MYRLWLDKDPHFPPRSSDLGDGGQVTVTTLRGDGTFPDDYKIDEQCLLCAYAISALNDAPSHPWCFGVLAPVCLFQWLSGEVQRGV